MQPRTLLYAAAAVAMSAGAAGAQETVTLWHPFTLETDMIHGGIKPRSTNRRTTTASRPRIVPGPQIATELIKAIATGSVPDLVTIDNPVVRELLGAGRADRPDRPRRQIDMVKPDIYFKGPWTSVLWKGRIYGVPRDANTLALYYNADMFRAEGPRSRQAADRPGASCCAAAEKLRDPDKNVFGFGFCAMQGEEGTFQWLPFLLPGRRLDRQARLSRRRSRRCSSGSTS